MLSQDLLNLLRCPACDDRPRVELTADQQALACVKCHRHYPVKHDIPIMLVDEATIPGATTATLAS